MDTVTYYEETEKSKKNNPFKDIKLEFYGEQCYSSVLDVDLIAVEEYVIYVVLTGKFILENKNEKISVERANAILIRPGQSVKFIKQEQDKGFVFWIGISGKGVEDILPQIGFTSEMVIKLGNIEDVDKKMTELLQIHNQDMVNELKRQNCFYSLMNLLTDKNQKNINTEPFFEAESKYVRKAINIIIENCDKKLKVNDIAKQIGINRSYLTNLFKKELGISPQNYIIEYRLEKASQLLKETKKNMVDVALEVGYSDSLSFSKAFKQRFGKSPSKYRKENN